MKFRFFISLLLVGFSLPAFAQIKQQKLNGTPTKVNTPKKMPVKSNTIQSHSVKGSPATNSQSFNAGIAAIKPANGSVLLQWNKPIIISAPEHSTSITLLNFTGATYDARLHNLPRYYRRIRLNQGMNHATVSITNPVYTPLSEAEQELITSYVPKKFITTDVNLKYSLVLENKQPYIYLSLIPIRKTTNGRYQKLTSFTLNVQQSYAGSVKRTARIASSSFAANSVLATGTWYKIGVTKNGIYKLDYTFFKNMGYDMSSLVPADIRIYGDGGAMLSDLNSAPHTDDLVENPIYVNGQSDAQFNTGDYVLFYGQGTSTWTYNNSDKRYHHQVNLYSDTTYYFITADLGPGKRIITQPSGFVPTDTVTTFDDYAYHELDAENLIQSGAEWFGEIFDAVTSYNIGFNFPNIVTAPSSGYINVAIASRYGDSSKYQIGPSTTITDSPVSTGCYYCAYASMNTGSYTFTPTGATVNLTLSKQTPGAIGWLYYVEANVRRSLIMSTDGMEFRDMNSVGAGKVSLFRLNASYPLQVWDITNPINAQAMSISSPSSGTYQFITPTDSLKQFIAFDGNSYQTPTYFGAVPNQNLHNMAQPDLVIVTNPKFLTQAEQLADFHTSHDGLKVDVATTWQVYNEFSSGRQDPMAIRDFMRMFYTRATNYATTPKYLLLFGAASYDPKYRIGNNTNYVIGYESPESFDPTTSYVSDDFYAVLDTNEGSLTSLFYSLDIGVGRMAADNTDEAQTLVNKIISYETPSGEPVTATTNCCTPQAQYNMGNWRNVVCFVAHDGDGGLHEGEADQVAQYVAANYPDLDANKIYCDSYQEVQTPGGPRYPDVNIAIDNQVNQGALIVNYTGHGGPSGFGLQRFLTMDDIYSWTNSNKLTFLFTASCQFAAYDNPGLISAGQTCLTLQNGGAIGLMTTTRDTYSGGNFALDMAFFQHLYSPLPDGTLPRTGDLFKIAKNIAGTGTNSLAFAYLGDPAVRLAYPTNKVFTSTVNTSPATGPADTLKALSKVTITGYVGDTAGNLLSTFNGLLYPIVYDKPDSLVTLNNPADPTANIYFPYALQKTILYKGKISVNNGKFSFSFIVPKDINYSYGFGKLSYYAQNGSTDATGSYQNIIIGGSSPNAYNNGRGPGIKLYLNDSSFVFGGLTNENPQLYATVFDSNGVNTTGNGIGHDITAVLDNNTQNTYDLTNYYQPALNSYQKGTITYPFTNLSEGKHSLSLRVWNVYNNSTQTYTEFNVEPKSSLTLEHVLNYPDPFTTHTQFWFEVNQSCSLLNVQIQVFTVSGKLVRNIVATVKTSGFRPQPIDWNGRDDYGDRIANGVYIYHLRVRTSEGATADTYQKLVIL